MIIIGWGWILITKRIYEKVIFIAYGSKSILACIY